MRGSLSSSPAFTDAELAMIMADVLFAGHETTVNRLSIGIPLRLEVLRLATPEGFGPARYAREDITVNTGPREVAITGDAVILATFATSTNSDCTPNDSPTGSTTSRSPRDLSDARTRSPEGGEVAAKIHVDEIRRIGSGSCPLRQPQVDQPTAVAQTR